MINKETLLILGAGASSEYGFPVGSQLIKEIIAYYKNPAFKKLTALICELDRYKYPVLGDLEYASSEEVKHHVTFSPIVQPKNSFVDEFVNALKKSHSASIDDFLYHHEKYRLIGKVSILLNLIKKERVYNQEQHGWYSYLWKTLYQGTDGNVKNILKNKIKIITFNYERSLERFLYAAMLNMYSFNNPEDAIEIINQIPIYHVYGRLGKLPWQNIEAPICDFGDSLETGPHLGMIQNAHDNEVTVLDKNVFDLCKHILSIAKSIKIYHEEQDMKIEYKKIIRGVNRIYFLGFGYLEQNMNILGFHKDIPSFFRFMPKARIYGTTYKMGEAKIEEIHQYFENIFWSMTNSKGNPKNPKDLISSQHSGLDIESYFEKVVPLK